MRRQLFAAGVSVALLFGAASPALAGPGKGHANGHHKPAKPNPKAKTGRITGGGVTGGRGAGFSIEARAGQPAKGHFNYTSPDGTLKVRCKSVDFSRVVNVAPADPEGHITAKCVEMVGSQRKDVSVDATFFDRAKGDEANITFTRPDKSTVTDNGVLREGSIKIRN